MTGNELKGIHAQLGITQQELAKKLGVAQVTVARWEIGLRHIAEPMARFIELIAKEVRKDKKKK